MKRMLSAALAALTLGVASIAPATPAFADDHRGRYSQDYDRGGRDWDRGRDRHGGRDYDNRRYYGGDNHYRRHRDNDDDDAIVAGVVGLALGAVLGAALASPPSSNYSSAPPQRYYDEGRYYDNQRTCYRRERQYDRYAGRTVTVDVPYSC